MVEKVTDSILNVGVNDYDIKIFENQYILEKGMAYNSYVILDEKVAVMDNVDAVSYTHLDVYKRQVQNFLHLLLSVFHLDLPLITTISMTDSRESLWVDIHLSLKRC